MSAPVPLREQIAELERELRMRRSVYPKWLKATPPRITEGEAAHRIAALEAAIETLKNTQQGSLFR